MPPHRNIMNGMIYPSAATNSYGLHFNGSGLTTPVKLQYVPYSKSYMIRIMAMAAIAGHHTLLESWRGEGRSCRDIDTMREALLMLKTTQSGIIPVGDAGTVWRFVTSIAALQTEREVALQGSKRLYERPITPLVAVLQRMGAMVSAPTQQGEMVVVSPCSSPLRGVDVDADTGKLSSQFLSSLLLIAPYLSSPLTVALPLTQRSRPYVELTCMLMHRAGARVVWDDERVVVEPSTYRLSALQQLFLEAEPDWTAMSYAYAWCAIKEGPKSIFIPQCARESMQGDSALSRIMEHFSVVTRFFPNGVLVERLSKENHQPLQMDLADHIDLVPSLFFTCLACQKPFHFTRIGSLRYKESDRLSALHHIGHELGYSIEHDNDSLRWNGTRSEVKHWVVVDPREDHRLAMSLTALAPVHNNIRLLTPNVVEKSYPLFWQDAKSVGICLQEPAAQH